MEELTGTFDLGLTIDEIDQASSANSQFTLIRLMAQRNQ